MPWCPTNKLELYKAIILLAHVSEIANNAVSFLGVATSLNNKVSNNIYFSANDTTCGIVDLVLVNLFCARYKYKSLKYGPIKYPAHISFTVTGKCVPFRTYLCIIFNIFSILAFFGNNLYACIH